MSDISEFVDIKPKHGSTGGCSLCSTFSRRDFEVGDKVRLFLGTQIRAGEVLDPNAYKKTVFGWGEPAVQLRVTQAGRLAREDPRDVSARNGDGCLVQSTPELGDVAKPYTRSFLYAHITRAQKVNNSTEP